MATMLHSAALIAICFLCHQLVTSFIVTPFRHVHRARHDFLTMKGNQFVRNTQLSSAGGGDLDRELDKFFELAAESGYENIKNMTPEERVERVIRGEQLENEIFDLRSDLMQLEDEMMAGKVGVDIEAVKEMRKRMDSLKAEYKDIVGAKDLPLYFGRLADSLQ